MCVSEETLDQWKTAAGDPPGQWAAASDSGRSAASPSHWHGRWCRFPPELAGPETRAGPLPPGVKKPPLDTPVTDTETQLDMDWLLVVSLVDQRFILSQTKGLHWTVLGSLRETPDWLTSWPWQETFSIGKKPRGKHNVMSLFTLLLWAQRKKGKVSCWGVSKLFFCEGTGAFSSLGN